MIQQLTYKELEQRIHGLKNEAVERKRAEEALLKSEKKLSIAKRMEVIGFMAAGIAHDLNNILSGIVGYPDLILMDLHENSPLRKTYEKIIKINHSQKAIISSGFTETEDVNAIQKLGAGKYIKKPITLETLAHAVKEELRR